MSFHTYYDYLSEYYDDNQGIGEAAVRLLAQHGASVIVSDLDSNKCDAVASSINAAGGSAISVPGDMTNPDFPSQLVKESVGFSNGVLNHIVNNAGFCNDRFLHKMSDKQWQSIQDIHTTAPFRLIRAAAPHMRLKDGIRRSVTNISSTSGLHGNIGQANYATAKAGIVGLTKTVAKEWYTDETHPTILRQ
jgi:3-oxoacyl-[acyl-carrier protein] reductase